MPAATFYEAFLEEVDNILDLQEKVAAAHLRVLAASSPRPVKTAGAWDAFREGVQRHVQTVGRQINQKLDQAHPMVAEGARKYWGHVSGATVRAKAKEHAKSIAASIPSARKAAPLLDKTEDLEKLLAKGRVSKNTRFGERGIQTRPEGTLVGGWSKPVNAESPAYQGLRDIARARNIRRLSRVGTAAVPVVGVGLLPSSKQEGRSSASGVRYY